MTKEKVQRLRPKTSVLKKLFAYSGNLCAMPECNNSLVLESGTMTGKVAHIHAAEKGGARFDENMSNEERRAFENLFIVCATCHDVIDDKVNERTYTASELKSYKKEHENRFRTAESELLHEYSDLTQQSAPVMPSSLKRLSETVQQPTNFNVRNEVNGLRDFVEKLAELPLKQRCFALAVAKRMKRQWVETLPVDDVVSAFGITHNELKTNMDLIEHYGLGSVDEGFEPGEHFVNLWERKPAGNPWIEILEFCELSGDNPDDFILNLNFALYDQKKARRR